MKLLYTLTLLSAVVSAPAFSCASCGSGGDDPLILYPNENWKAYLGMSNVGNYKLITGDGGLSEEPGPERKVTTTLAVGKKLSLRSFATLSLPFVTNYLGDRSSQGFGDPSIAGRYTIYPLNLAEEYLPQIQFLMGYRHSTARGIAAAQDEDLLDVMGSGYSQVRLGMDIWSGLTPVQYGFALVHAVPLERTIDGKDLQPGREWRATVSAGQTFSLVKYVFGASRTWVGQAKETGQKVPESQQYNNSVFATFDVFADDASTVRASLARQAAFGKNSNTSRSDSLAVAYMRAL